MTDVKTAYPDQYYASYDTTATQPTTVTGWYDAWTNTGTMPAAADMIAVSAADWADTTFRTATGKGVQDGKIISYTPAIPLATQAQGALTSARTYVYNNYGILNETTPDAWVTYLKTLMAIANGTDTTSTTLPTQPSETAS